MKCATTLAVLFSVLCLMFATAAPAELIVNLLPVEARFDSLTDNDDGAGGFGAGDPGGQNSNGLQFNVTFTPATGDLDSTPRAVNVLEIGGDANGSGLYLLGGELHFISKMDGNGANTVNLGTLNDLAFNSGNNMIGVKSSFGALTAGTEYSVAVLFDPITAATLDIGVKAGADPIATESYAISGVGGKTNWSGDDSATAFRGNPPNNVGNLGGALINTDGNTAYPFHEDNINANPFEGTQGQALYWTQSSAVIRPPLPPPTPGVSVLLADFEGSATGAISETELDAGTVGGSWTIAAAEESSVRAQGGNQALNVDRGSYDLALDFGPATPLDEITLSYDSYIQRTSDGPNEKKNFLTGLDSDGDEVFKLVLATDGTDGGGTTKKGRLRYVDAGGTEITVIDGLNAENGDDFASSKLQNFQLEFTPTGYNIFVEDVFLTTAPYRNPIGAGIGMIDSLAALSFEGSGSGTNLESGAFYDNIDVSISTSTVIPEPSALLLWTLGLLGLGCYAGRRRSK